MGERGSPEIFETDDFFALMIRNLGENAVFSSFFHKYTVTFNMLTYIRILTFFSAPSSGFIDINDCNFKIYSRVANRKMLTIKNPSLSSDVNLSLLAIIFEL